MRSYSIKLTTISREQNRPGYNIWGVLIFLLFKVKKGYKVQVNGDFASIK